MTAHPFPALLRTAKALEPEFLLLTEPMADRGRPRLTAALAMAIGFAGLVIVLIAPAFGPSGRATLWQWAFNSAEPALEIELPPAMPIELVAATRGERAAIVATGQAAQTINAALPFSSAPIEAARPFTIPGGASMSTADRALHCLTQAVYYEAAYEPIEGRRAVAQVVLNRVRHPAFPNSVCGVVYDGASRRGCQFSFTCDGSLRRTPAPAAWAAAAQVARDALRGEVTSAVGLATHYHANYVAPYWAPRLTKLRQIGAHIFYRWPGQWGRTAAFSSRYAGSEAILLPAPLEAEAAMAVEALPPDPTDRRTAEDVGGRLDVTKGWTLTIPMPSDTRGSMATVLERQAQAAAAATQVAANGNQAQAE